MGKYNIVNSNLRIFWKAKVCYEKNCNDIKDHGKKKVIFIKICNGIL